MSEKTQSKKLSRLDLVSMATGQIIGVGIMTMTGIAIGFTGRSVNIAYLIAGLITIFSAVPQIFIGGTANFPGGQYTQIAVLSGQKLAGIYNYINLCMSFAISMYTLSFCDYFLSLFPGANVRLISLIVLVILFGMHIVGVKQAARLQNVLILVLALAIASYIAFGIGHIQPGYFSGPDFMYGGPTGFLIASIYLSFAAGGATYVVNYSGEAEHPTRDIPFAIIISTVGIVVVYALMSTIAAGVLPVAEVANQPLSVSAASFMPKSVFTFFVVGGAMFALLTTLNFSIGMLVYPTLRACQDGWLPKKLAVRNKRFGTAHFVLLVFFLVGIVPILLGLNLNTIANSTVILTTCIRGVIAVAALQLPKKMPEMWNRSKFHVGNGALKFFSVFTVFFAAVSVVLLLVTSPKAEIIGNVAILAICTVIALLRNKHVHLDATYTEV